MPISLDRPGTAGWHCGAMAARAPAAALATLLLLWPTATVQAQECGNWSQPVLCRAELRTSIDSAAWERFDPDDGIRLAPNQHLEIEIEGRDQYGRTFRADRLALAFDDWDCERYLQVEDRGQGRLELQVTVTMGRCRLDLWVPGNLNFAWRIELDISPAARSGYSFEEAEIVVRSLYLAILDREVDAASLGPAITEIQRGNLDAQILAMLRSGEFQQSIGGLAPEQILDRFYRGILQRPSDSGGLRTYFSLMQQRRYLEVLVRMLRSEEFERRLQR